MPVRGNKTHTLETVQPATLIIQIVYHHLLPYKYSYSHAHVSFGNVEKYDEAIDCAFLMTHFYFRYFKLIRLRLFLLLEWGEMPGTNVFRLIFTDFFGEC